MANATTDIFGFEDSVEEGGKTIRNLDDHIMVWFSSERGVYYTDNRNEWTDDGEITVKAIGKDCQGYVYYVCPTCGRIHFIHQGRIGRFRRIQCYCTTRPKLDVDGKIQRQEAKYIHLDCSELANNFEQNDTFSPPGMRKADDTDDSKTDKVFESYA